MPYSGPDKYFVSNGNYAAFMQWLHEIRDELIMLPNNSATVLYEAASLQLFLQAREASMAARNLLDQHIDSQASRGRIKALEQELLSRASNVLTDFVLKEKHKDTEDISKAYKDETKSFVDKIDEKVRGTEKLLEGVSETIKTEGIRSIKFDSDAMKKEQETLKKSIPDVMTRVGADIKQEVEGFNRNELDANNPIPEADRIDGNTRSRFGQAQEQEYTATNFPEHGKESGVADAALRISEVLGDTYQFEVVSGYKPKGDKTPATKEYKSWIVKSSIKDEWDIDATRTFSLTRPHSDYANEILQKIEKAKYPGSYKFFIEKLHGRYADGTPYKLNEIKSQKNVIDAKGQNLSNRMVFSAYIDNYNDGYTIASSDYSFLGRAETVPIYKSTTRDMTLEFTLLADYSSELMVGMQKLNQQLQKADKEREEEILKKIVDSTGFDWGLGQASQPRMYNDGRAGGHIPGMYSDSPQGLWSKMTFLAQCMYPYYRDDGKMKEQPMFRMRIADFYDCIIFPKGMQIQMTALGDAPQIDLNPSSLGNMPLGIKVTLTGQIVHNYEPASNFYGFYNRVEFDKKTLDPVTGVDINLHKDKIVEGGSVKSPYQFNNKEHNEKDLDLNTIPQKSGLFDDFKNSFNSFASNQGVNLSDVFQKQKLKKAMASYLAINEVVDHLRVLQGLDPIGSAKSIIDNVKKGNFATAIDKAKNLGTSSIEKFNTLKQQGKDYVATAENKLNSAKEKVNSVIQKGKILEDDIVKTAQQAAKNPTTVKLPQTMQDILDKSKKTT
jgi:hypothetical protein